MAKKPVAPAWAPAAYDLADVEAVRAVSKGLADPAQQARALAWIVNSVAATYEVSYRSNADGGDRETSFAEGRRFVGLQIVKMVNMPPNVFAALRDKNAG